MSTIYLIKNTEGDTILALQPGALNGPNGSNADSDLQLYGQGAVTWGQGFNNNFYKLIESFSCPEKGASPGTPQDDDDLGPGNGINNPITGQQWYNTTTGKMMVYDASIPGWKSSGGTVSSTTEPPAPQPGDLWYDETVPQLKVYDDDTSSFLSVADRYLLKSGGTLTGFLTLHADPSTAFQAATKQYVDNEIDSNLAAQAFTDLSDVTVTNNPSAPFVKLSGGIWGNHTLVLTDISNVTATVTEVNRLVGVTSAVQTQLNARLNLSGGTLTNFLTLHADPSSALHAATKQYVDDEIAAITGGGGDVPVIFNQVGTPGGKDGDIWINSSVISIRSAGTWRQIWPAQYS